MASQSMTQAAALPTSSAARTSRSTTPRSTSASTIWRRGGGTDARPLRLYREPPPGKVAASDGPSARELLAAYGENDLARQQIPLGSGTVKVQGSGIPAGHTVWVAGRQIPVDPKGNFAAEEMLPAGAHSVEVAVLDHAANGSLSLPDLQFKRTA